jgi:hypothetical protein
LAEKMPMKLRYFVFLLIIFTSCSDKKEPSDQTSGTAIHPLLKDRFFNLTFANVIFEVDSNTGGRISSLQLAGKELLYVSRDSSNNNWGSTFWPSPQSLWGWPPPAILDNAPYKSSIRHDTLILQSDVAALPKVYVRKSFSASLQDTSIRITYTLHNAGDSVLKIAPWEITRVPSGGHIVFPKGNDQVRGELKPLTKDSIGMVWLDYDSTGIPSGIPKLFADGAEGWIAYINNSRQILIKKFQDAPVTLKAPDPEDEIEIYTHPDNHYIEVEQQGPYADIPAKSSSSWTVTWYARNIPDGVDIHLGSASLIQYIRNIVK